MYSRVQTEIGIEAIFFAENGKSNTIRQIQPDCRTGEVADAFASYKASPGILILCIGPAESDEVQSYGMILQKKCHWFPPCEPQDEDSLANGDFAPFFYHNVTSMTSAERLEECCKSREEVQTTRLKHWFVTLERRTKVFHQREFSPV